MIKKIFLPLLAAMIWGFAFSAQSSGSAHVPPFTFNASRSIIAVVTLSVVYLLSINHKKRHGLYTPPKGGNKALLLGGVCCGTIMAIATNLQQMGLGETDAGKASFITALYIVLVPIFGIFLRKRTHFLTLVSVVLAVVGMYLLCVQDGFTMQASDVYVLICAFCFALHILAIDHFAPLTDCIALSLLQFVVMAVESAFLALVWETPTWSGISSCLWEILYVGVLSSGVAYTLQIIAQKDADPTLVSLLLSLESVFGALGGAIFLGERMTAQEYLGCAVMLFAILLSQLPHDLWNTLLKRFGQIRK